MCKQCLEEVRKRSQRRLKEGFIRVGGKLVFILSDNRDLRKDFVQSDGWEWCCAETCVPTAAHNSGWHSAHRRLLLVSRDSPIKL